MKPTSRPIHFIPHSTNWSEMETPNDNSFEQSKEFDAGDESQQIDQTLSNLQADQTLFKLLMNLDDRGKIILLYQVLREAGYNLTHQECAKTLNMSRVWYSSETKEVKQKCIKIIQDTSK